MNPIRLDPALLEKLLAAMQTVDICDQSGKIVGHFTPIIDPADFELFGPEISEEELRRRIESKEPRYTTAEVLQYLERL
jgi:hypothetical protein